MGLEHSFWTGDSDDYWARDTPNYDELEIRPRFGMFVTYFEEREGRSMHCQTVQVTLKDIGPLAELAKEGPIEAETAVIWARRELAAGRKVYHYSSW